MTAIVYYDSEHVTAFPNILRVVQGSTYIKLVKRFQRGSIKILREHFKSFSVDLEA